MNVLQIQLKIGKLMQKYYDLKLSEWILLSMHKKSLESTIASIDAGLPIIFPAEEKRFTTNRAYFQKLLREEITKQFTDRYRPFVEVVLNSIDAYIAAGKKTSCRVDINLKKDFVAKDDGIGMNLEDILKLLIIPFQHEKEGIEEIGRYGTGFLSAFKFCLEKPKKTHVIVDTRQKRKYIADFYSTSKNISDLRMRVTPGEYEECILHEGVKGILAQCHEGPISILQREAKSTGTKVRMTNIGEERHRIAAYIEDKLKGIPTYLAEIYQGNKQINAEKNSSWYSVDVDLDIGSKKVKQKLGLRLEPSSSIIELTAQGVQVKNLKSFYGGATISFPGAIKLVEGRDDFKQDENYTVCVNAAFLALEEHAKELSSEREQLLAKFRDLREANIASNKERDKLIDNRMRRDSLIDFIPSMMSAFGKSELSEINNIDVLKNELVGQRKYVLTKNEHVLLLPFMGRELDKLAFSCGEQSYNYWKHLYPRRWALMNEHLAPKEIIEFKEAFIAGKYNDQEFDKKLAMYPNLKILANLFFLYSANNCEPKKLAAKKIVLVETKPGLTCTYFHSETGMLLHDAELYINIAHPALKDNSGAGFYQLFNDFFSDIGFRAAFNVNHETAEKYLHQTIFDAGTLMKRNLYSMINNFNYKLVDALDETTTISEEKEKYLRKHSEFQKKNVYTGSLWLDAEKT